MKICDLLKLFSARKFSANGGFSEIRRRNPRPLMFPVFAQQQHFILFHNNILRRQRIFKEMQTSRFNWFPIGTGFKSILVNRIVLIACRLKKYQLLILNLHKLYTNKLFHRQVSTSDHRRQPQWIFCSPGPRYSPLHPCQLSTDKQQRGQ